MLEEALERVKNEPGRSDLPLEIALPGLARILRELPAIDAENAGLSESEVS